MNPLFNEAAQTVQGTWVMGIMTAAFLFFFIGWIVWAYHPERREAMEKAARMPFSDGDES